MTYQKIINISKEKEMLFNQLMHDDTIIESPIAILDVMFENDVQAIISLAGTASGKPNGVWIEINIWDKSGNNIAAISPQTELFDTFNISSHGDEYIVTINRYNIDDIA